MSARRSTPSAMHRGRAAPARHARLHHLPLHRMPGEEPGADARPAGRLRATATSSTIERDGALLPAQPGALDGRLAEARRRGTWSADDLKRALEARDRKASGPVAPPDGLYLVAVDYPPTEEALARAGRRTRPDRQAEQRGRARRSAAADERSGAPSVVPRDDVGEAQRDRRSRRAAHRALPADGITPSRCSACSAGDQRRDDHRRPVARHDERHVARAEAERRAPAARRPAERRTSRPATASRVSASIRRRSAAAPASPSAASELLARRSRARRRTAATRTTAAKERQNPSTRHVEPVEALRRGRASPRQAPARLSRM